MSYGAPQNWDVLKERQLCFILCLCLVPVASSCWWCSSLLGFSFSYRALWRRITTWFRMWENRAKRKAMAAVTCLDPKTQHHTTWSPFFESIYNIYHIYNDWRHFFHDVYSLLTVTKSWFILFFFRWANVISDYKFCTASQNMSPYL